MNKTNLGPYRLIKRLGYGGMCEVYLAQRFGASGFDKLVALKVLLPEYIGQGVYERQLILEAVTGAKLNHQNIAQVYDLGMDQGLYYIVMEYIDGADLRTCLHHGPPSMDVALWLISQIALALHYLHTFQDEKNRWLGLVHRDVSPSNILITQTGTLKLIDFGITKATQNRDKTHGRVRKGKYAYMSPEYISGKALGPTSDLFSLGIVFAELLSGQRPFDREEVMATMEQIKNENPADLSYIDEHVRPILHQCLQKNPEHRHQSAKHLYEAVTNHMREHGLFAGPFEVQQWLTDQNPKKNVPRLKKSDATM